MATVDFLHHENPPIRAGVQPETLDAESQRKPNTPPSWRDNVALCCLHHLFWRNLANSIMTASKLYCKFSEPIARIAKQERSIPLCKAERGHASELVVAISPLTPRTFSSDKEIAFKVIDSPHKLSKSIVPILPVLLMGAPSVIPMNCIAHRVICDSRSELFHFN
ncbi:hypothetical protein TNCV_3629811 [Trichonephila clavipes]|nr:hypothetical protein TNCV_3629811 [Trichonephila clavipes]